MMGRLASRFAAGFAAACLMGGVVAAIAAAPAYAQDSTSTTATPTSASIVIGSSNSASAVVGGDATFGSPTGTVTFYECGPTPSAEPCTDETNQLGSPVDVTPGDSDTSSAASISFTPTSTGYWCFAAQYSGDDNYGASSDTTTDACFDVTSDTSTTTTTPASASIVLGSSNSDSAVVSGDATNGSPTGTVTFYECGPTPSATPCTSEANQVGTPVTVTAGDSDTSSAASISFTPTSTGFWCFAGQYSGDDNYAASSDTTTDECFDVTAATSSTTTTPSKTSIVLGSSNSDSALVTGVSGGPAPTGTVTFYECGPTPSAAPCTSETNQVGTPVTVTTGNSDTSSAASISFTPTSTGFWCFAGQYSGDGNYSASSDTTIDECFDVTAATSTTTTTPTAATITYEGSDSDVATVTGNSAGGSPTGTVTFYYCYSNLSPAACTAKLNKVGTGPVTLTAGAGDTSTATSANLNTASLGYYCFGAYYSGSTNYQASSDTAVAECFDVLPPAPQITSFSPASGPPGTTVTIHGTNLENATSVKIGGVTVTILSDTANKIKVKVPTSGAHSGKITVTTASGTATSSSKFKVT